MFSRFHLRFILGAVVGLLLSVPAIRAQSVSPVIVEYQEKARGQFRVSNSTLYPMDVVLEPFGFTVNQNGEPTYGPLDPGIHVRLSATSFRLGPKQIYTVFYEATADVLPAWFTIYATTTRSNSRTNFRVAFQLPHTVYLLPRKPLERDALQFHRAEARGGGPVQVEVENRSSDFGRVQEVELQSSSGKKTYPGFPFFPHQRRLLQLEADPGARPERVILKFMRFKVEQPVWGTGASR